jgi:hypothetical protein
MYGFGSILLTSLRSLRSFTIPVNLLLLTLDMLKYHMALPLLLLLVIVLDQLLRLVQGLKSGVWYF